MNERDERNELTGQLAMNGKGKLSTSRRGIMKAMALTTVGTAAASVYLPTASAAPPAAIDDTDTGGSVHKAATFPTTPGFSYRSYTGSDFHAETNSDDDIYDTNGAIHAAPGPNDPSVWVLYLDYPNGTVIREVVLFYIDNDAVKNIEGRLVRYDPTTQSATRVADFISSGAASTTIKASPLTINGAGPFPVTVDTTTFAYTVRVLLPVTANVQLLGVRVGFTNDGIFNSFQLLPAASGVGAPVAGAHLAGELYTDSAGSLFYCKASGSPGTWINLTAVIAPVPSLHFLPTPERFVDTRAGAGNIGGVTGPLSSNRPRPSRSPVVTDRAATPPSRSPMPPPLSSARSRPLALVRRCPVPSSPSGPVACSRPCRVSTTARPRRVCLPHSSRPALRLLVDMAMSMSSTAVTRTTSSM